MDDIVPALLVFHNTKKPLDYQNDSEATSYKN
ncbi:hypothetical protein J2Z37_004355 [Ammoniphilus resinae]|uniref:Uncharacterized protein n=1 Tax=Ammoniphilus resinae TaxID=861532 RepID=A0ABS4GVP4_9BACL|nr:hypothetical protein [Ammoniphilus resinae]